MVPNDIVGLTTYSLLIHCLSSLIAIKQNRYGGVLVTLFFRLILQVGGIRTVLHIRISGVYSQVSEQL